MRARAHNTISRLRLRRGSQPAIIPSIYIYIYEHLHVSTMASKFSIQHTGHEFIRRRCGQMKTICSEPLAVSHTLKPEMSFLLWVFSLLLLRDTQNQ